MFRLLLFAIGTLFFLWISRHQLKNPKTHGFYRFFVFEGVLLLILLNHPNWFHNPLSPRQLLSWALLATSIFLVLQALLMLRRKGGFAARKDMPENFTFENTERVVDEGIYKYIRHPMYSSLLFLGVGAFLKDVNILTVILVVMVSVMMTIAAKVEERENIRHFGTKYQEYIKRTRMFVPFVV